MNPSSHQVSGKIKAGYVRPLDIKHGRVDMSHGSGGRAMAQLINELFINTFQRVQADFPHLATLLPSNRHDDFAQLPTPPELALGGKLVFATDSHVVSPLFFAGGDIGSLAVHGTVNDLSMAGARPLWLSAGFILEEGFLLADLQKIAESMALAAAQAGVLVVTGDTKVVEAGKGDGVFINTSGIGVSHPSLNLSGAQVQVGDVLLVSGYLGDHGVAIMSQREGLSFGTQIESDSQALNGLVSAMIKALEKTNQLNALRVLRDPTRGGLGNTLNEIATQSGVGMSLQEAQIPVRPAVRAACELLGLDPLYVANEGKLLAICAAEAAPTLLAAMHAHPQGRDAAIIGTTHADAHHFVQMHTVFGGRRMVDWLAGEQLPRIC